MSLPLLTTKLYIPTVRSSVVARLRLITLGSVHYEWNELDAAEAHVREGIALGIRGGYHYPLFSGHLVLSAVLQARSDFDGATAALNKAAEVASDVSDWWAVVEQTERRVQLWLAQSNIGAVVGWADGCGLTSNDPPSYRHEAEHITLAGALIARGRSEPAYPYLHEAALLLSRLRRAAQSVGRGGRVIRLLCLESLALAAQGHTDRALQGLQQALALAEPEGYVRTFVDEGPPMASLLHEAVRRGRVTGDIDQLIAAASWPPNECPKMPIAASSTTPSKRASNASTTKLVSCAHTSAMARVAASRSDSVPVNIASLPAKV